MVVTSAAQTQAESLKSHYDRDAEVKAFDDSKAGVKGLVDAGVTEVPRIFIHDQSKLGIFPVSASSHDSNLEVPVIDFQGIGNDASIRAKVIDQVRHACQTWGAFQLINHGIPKSILVEMICGIRRFHEQDVEVKKEYYTRDYRTKNLLYNTNFNLLEATAACWRDTLTFITGVYRPINPEELPATCRDIMMTYTNEIMKIGVTIYELLSLSLGLDPNYLKDLGCADGFFAPCHYYPACPQPDLTIGATAHADCGFITILLQGQLGGLQVLHENQWHDVVPIPGALVVNIGAILQLMTNDMFIAPLHRVIAKAEGPRISVACLFRTHHHPENSSKAYGPIKELLTEENPPIYREVTVRDIVTIKHAKKPEGAGPKHGSNLPSILDGFRI